MATAPFFRRNSKNLLVQDRNVREAIADGIIDFIHVLYENFDADLNAKPSCPLEFIRKGSTLLNIVAAPQPLNTTCCILHFDISYFTSIRRHVRMYGSHALYD